MAIRQVIKIGDGILREKSLPVGIFDERIWKLLDDMKETLEHENGAGLAAVQVGILKRAFIIVTPKKMVELINPQIIRASGELADSEGCLSIPGERGNVVRPAKVKVSAQDRFGTPFCFKAEGYTARAVCHELDHLDGILYIDKMVK